MVTVQIPWYRGVEAMLRCWSGLLAWPSACIGLCINSTDTQIPGPHPGLAEQDSMPSFWAGLQIFFPAQTGTYHGLHSRHNSLGWSPKLPNKLRDETGSPTQLRR